jgi:energy coupling factor transporter S component ThiW
MKSTQLITRMGVLIALGVAASYMNPIAIPGLGAFGARLFPVQAAIDVVAGAMLGPWYAVGVAFLISLIRVILGTGTPLAFPGSMFGALLAGLLYRMIRGRTGAVAAAIGEVVGTGVIGALVSYPIAVGLLGNAKAAAGGMTFYIIPFTSSSVAGAILGCVVLLALQPVIAPVPRTR